jgi:hypothetical protein
MPSVEHWHETAPAGSHLGVVSTPSSTANFSQNCQGCPSVLDDQGTEPLAGRSSTLMVIGLRLPRLLSGRTGAG